MKSSKTSRSASVISPLEDGRQSPRALAVRRGVGRLLASWNYCYVPELTLPDGRRADMVGLGPKGEIWIIEIKSSLADWRADTKWRDYLNHCDYFSFATLPDVPSQVFPTEVGLLIGDEYGAEIAREASYEPLNPSKRKGLIVRLARLAAARLNHQDDPAWNENSVT